MAASAVRWRATSSHTTVSTTSGGCSCATSVATRRNARSSSSRARKVRSEALVLHRERCGGAVRPADPSIVHTADPPTDRRGRRRLDVLERDSVLLHLEEIRVGADDGLWVVPHP